MSEDFEIIFFFSFCSKVFFCKKLKKNTILIKSSSKAFLSLKSISSGLKQSPASSVGRALDFLSNGQGFESLVGR